MNAPKVTSKAPILLRRIKKVAETAEVYANMTVVTTGGMCPERGDQKNDRTAPRRD